MNKHSRGSEWLKWDLHIHSPYTHGTANKYEQTSIEGFCNEILNKKISCIGLTNYFYLREEEYNEVVKGLNGNCYVIPNFEFRSIDKNSKGDYINFHVLFNPQTTLIKDIIKCIGKVKLHNQTKSTKSNETN